MSIFEYTFWNAVGRGYTDTVHRSVTADPYYANAYDNHGWTALQIAVSMQKIQIIELLIEKGADVDKPGPHNWTALYIAISRGHYDVCEILLDAGAKILANDLPEASRNGDTDICELLLSKGASIDRKSADGNTALHRACADGHVQTIRMLLEKGASAEIKNKAGKTPEEVAGIVITHQTKAVQQVSSVLQRNKMGTTWSVISNVVFVSSGDEMVPSTNGSTAGIWLLCGDK